MIADREQMLAAEQVLVQPGLRFREEMIRVHKQFVRQRMVLQMPADHTHLQQQEVLIAKAGQQNKARSTLQVITNHGL